MKQTYFTKVPELTIGFWVLKIIATTLGEVGGNAVSLTMELGYLLGTIIFSIPLIVLVTAQINAKMFNPYLYWGTITLTTLAGTTLADFFDRSIGIGYLGGSLTLFTLVIATLAIWKKSLGSIDIKSINNSKAEAFYWTAIMFSQTLGTALGDWMADSTSLGYKGSALFISIILIVITGLYYKKNNISNVLLFWAAFILTRPLGATLANSMDKPIENGGMGISDFTITSVLALLMVLCLIFIPQRVAGHNN